REDGGVLPGRSSRRGIREMKPWRVVKPVTKLCAVFALTAGALLCFVGSAIAQPKWGYEGPDQRSYWFGQLFYQMGDGYMASDDYTYWTIGDGVVRTAPCVPQPKLVDVVAGPPGPRGAARGGPPVPLDLLALPAPGVLPVRLAPPGLQALPARLVLLDRRARRVLLDLLVDRAHSKRFTSRRLPPTFERSAGRRSSS